MLSLESALYVRVQELPHGPMPLPLKSGFNMHTAYRALGMFNPSETSDAFFILSNDRNETWFICNRHLRTVAFAPHTTQFRLPLHALAGLNPCMDAASHREPGVPDEDPSPQPVEPDEGPSPAQLGGIPPQHSQATGAPGYLMAPLRSV